MAKLTLTINGLDSEGRIPGMKQILDALVRDTVIDVRYNLSNIDPLMMRSGDYMVFVSKGRRMLQCDYLKSSTFEFLDVKLPLLHYTSFFIFDYGLIYSTDLTINHTVDSIYITRSYILPNGSKTSNRWDFYERLKRTPTNL